MRITHTVAGSAPVVVYEGEDPGETAASARDRQAAARKEAAASRRTPERLTKRRVASEDPTDG